MEGQPVTPGAALFSQAQVDALRRLKDAFEQKLLDEDEYKAEKAKVLNATPAAAPPAPADDDDDGFELVGVQTPAERAAESRRRAEAEGNVLEIDDDEPAAPAPAPRRNPRRGEERVVIRCRHVYFGTAVRRDVTVVFAPSGVTMEWRSDESGLYVQVRLEPSNMKTFDMYHRSHNVRADDDAIDPTAPDAIQDFVAIGLRQKPPNLRSIEGFRPTEENARKYIVIELEGDALLKFKREAVPAVVWGGHLGWPTAPVLGAAAAARPFLKGVEYADALRRSAAGEFVVPPVIQSYGRRVDHPVEEVEERVVVARRSKPARKDIVPLTTAEKAAVLHAIAQLDGKATQRKVRRAAESALGAPEGALDEKKAAIREVCEDEMSKQASESAAPPPRGGRRDFGLNLPAGASRRAYRPVVNFPGTQPRDEGRWVRGAFTGAPPPRAPKPKAKKLSGFMLFSKEMRPRVIADGQGLSFGDISKRLGELWRGLPDAEKARYNRTCVPA